MKGVSFQNGVEFRITIEGETWCLGSEIKGKLESKPLSLGKVYLVEGIEKKIKMKAPDAFVVIEERDAHDTPFDWSFPIPPGGLITDKNKSLYVLYGIQDALEKWGMLKLNIVPPQNLIDIQDVITHHFRFALKGVSNGKSGMAEFKFTPPDIKDWAQLEQLVLNLRMDTKHLTVQFQFHRNEVDATKGGLATKLVKREFLKEWPLTLLLHSFNGRVNKDVVTAEMDKVIAEYREQGWLSS